MVQQAARTGVRATVAAWAHLLLGGAALMPPFLLSAVLVAVVWRPDLTEPRWQGAAYLLALPMAAAAGSAAAARPLSAAAAQTLLGVPGEQLAEGPSHSWAARRRTAAWLVLHTGVGAALSALSLSVPPAVLVLLLLPLIAPDGHTDWPWTEAFGTAPPWSAPAVGVALLASLVLAAVLAGRLLRRVAPVLLGPTPADRLAEAERRAARLAESNRIARELHDSIGHALSAVTLQAGAARRVLDRDPEFVRRALAAVEETGRRAVEELDSVLGVLREDADGTRERPGLDALEPLLETTRAAGARVAVVADTGLEALPAAVSREGYRIVQEGLSNVLRHAGAVSTRLELRSSEKELTIVVENDLPGRPRRSRSGGGNGVAGIVERARLLGGSAESAPVPGGWRLTVRLPLRSPR